eukprot:TRINITY_DN2459_c0_g1_i1.p2 TRINITY_DN2459_c0_g1~~TRINITY_DN2459_c0_g1_i1.p2  ORF type:complete len:101 (-),score=18.41 TRINITY_DN2459_c0_g1_i1:261-563(-)
MTVPPASTNNPIMLHRSGGSNADGKMMPKPWRRVNRCWVVHLPVLGDMPNTSSLTMYFFMLGRVRVSSHSLHATSLLLLLLLNRIRMSSTSSGSYAGCEN